MLFSHKQRDAVADAIAKTESLSHHLIVLDGR
jgi:hypothetical protein